MQTRIHSISGSNSSSFQTKKIYAIYLNCIYTTKVNSLKYQKRYLLSITKNFKMCQDLAVIAMAVEGTLMKLEL